MKITRLMCPTSKYSIKCPYDMEAEGIAVHNTANKASAKAEVSYMIGNNNQVSYHYAIDDIEIVQAIEENRNTWNAGDGRNGRGNRKMISVEICHSTNPDINKFLASEKLTAKFVAYKLKEKGWGIDKVYKHQDFSGKYCPHKTLDLGWERFLNLIKAEMQETTFENTYTYTQFVKDVQYATGAKIDGIAGKETLSKTVTISKKKNRTHPTVRAVQKYLNALGYTEVGTADGIAGNKFDTAVKRYQKTNGCVVDGEITAGKTTWKKLLRLA